MRRFRETATETAGFYNTSGFVDDTRAFASIPARHDLCRRVDAGFLARWIAEAARVVLPGLRIVGEGSNPSDDVIDLMANAEGVWVGSGKRKA